MKTIFISILSVMLIGMFAPMASAVGSHVTEATVLKVSGNVQVQLPGQSGAVTVTPGMHLPQGAVITTGYASRVDLIPMQGAVSSIQPNTTVGLEKLSVTTEGNGAVTSQTAQLNLKWGNIASTLDPSNHAINHYSVRTPAGVAAARGTAYTVTVSETGTSVATLSGTVTLTPVGGGTPIVIDIGTGIVVSGPGNVVSQSLADLVATEQANGTAGNEGSITEAVSAMVQTVADAVSSGTISGGGATTLLTSVVSVATQANPSQASAYTSTAVDAANTANAQGGNVDTNAVQEAGNPGSSGTSTSTTPITPVDPTVVSPSGGQ